jgi:hypothetical protein
MRAKNVKTKLVAVAAVLAALVAIPLARSTTPAQVTTEPPEPIRQTFGLIGIAFGQTAQLNVVNVPPDPLLPPDPMVPPDPIQPVSIEMALVDGDGIILARRSAMLLPNESASLSVNRNSLDRRGNRVSLRALVLIQPPDPMTPPDPMQIISSLEVFDNLTGRTSVVLHPPDPLSPVPDDNVPR